MKSYTDIEQSKKLSEILPHESADMHYSNASIEGINYVDEYRVGVRDYNTAIKILSEYITSPSFKEVSGRWSLVPCWSLAALLEQIPERLFDNDGFSYDLEITKQNGLYYINYLDSYGRYYHVSAGCEDTLVDACVDMIIKLHE